MNQSTINEKQASGTVGKIRSLVLMLGNKLWFIFISKKSIVIPFHEVLTIQKIMPPYFNSLQTAAPRSICVSLPRGLHVYLVGLTGAGNGGSCGQAQSWLFWKEIRLNAGLDPAHTSIRHSWNLLLQHLCRIRQILSCHTHQRVAVKAERNVRWTSGLACDTYTDRT